MRKIIPANPANRGICMFQKFLFLGASLALLSGLSACSCSCASKVGPCGDPNKVQLARL